MPTQTDTQRQAAFSAAGLNSSQQANVVAGTPDPTIASSGVRRYTDTTAPTSAYDNAAAAAFAKGGALDTTAPDEAALRQQAMDAAQKQVDNIRNTYTGILATEATAGQNRLGQTRATAARSGTLGSDFGNAALDKTGQANAEQVQAIQAERDAKISSILSGAEDRATSLIEAGKNRAAQNESAYLTHLKGVADSAKTDVTNLAKSGLSVDELTDKQYQDLITQTGYSPAQLHAQFVINKPEDQVLHSMVEGNKYIVVSKDPITGATKSDSIDLGFTVPQDYTPTKLDNGTLVFAPKTFDPNKPIADQLLTYGTPSQSSQLDIKQKQATLDKTYAEIDKLKKDGTSSDVTSALQGAAEALSQGADKDKVRQRFLDNYPQQASLYNQYVGSDSTFDKLLQALATK